jgi:mannose-6-phosphate isomerase-like protein (cupin superfamily)
MIPTKNNIQKIDKGWGYELIIINKEYCGKILHFNQNAKMSMHFHIKKDETWYVSKGKFIFRWIDTSNAKLNEEYFCQGESIIISQGLPHQLEAIEESEIIEFSTHHFDNDSYRVSVGDSQKSCC